MKLVVSSLSCVSLLANVDAMNRADMSFDMPEANYCKIPFNPEQSYKPEYRTINTENQTLDHSQAAHVQHIKRQKNHKNVCKFLQIPTQNGHVSTHKHVAEAPQGKEFRPEMRRLDKTRPTKSEIRRNTRHDRKAEIKKAMND